MNKSNRRSFLVDVMTGAAGAWLTVTGTSVFGLFLSACERGGVAVKYGGPPPREPMPDKYGAAPRPPDSQGKPEDGPAPSAGTDSASSPEGSASPSSEPSASAKPKPRPVVTSHGGHSEPPAVKYGGPPRPPRPRKPMPVKYGGPPIPPGGGY